MSDVEEPVEEPVEAEEPVEVPEAPVELEVAEEPVEEPQAEATGRVRWEDEDGNEFFAGPGETIPETAEPV